jgi:hypothetical protein
MGDNSDGLLEIVPDEMLGRIIKKLTAGGLGNLQNEGRAVVERLFTRNAIFAAKVQQNHRINIPKAEVEKLDIEEGELVQVALTPIDSDSDE